MALNFKIPPNPQFPYSAAPDCEEASKMIYSFTVKLFTPPACQNKDPASTASERQSLRHQTDRIDIQLRSQAMQVEALRLALELANEQYDELTSSKRHVLQDLDSDESKYLVFWDCAKASRRLELVVQESDSSKHFKIKEDVLRGIAHHLCEAEINENVMVFPFPKKNAARMWSMFNVSFDRVDFNFTDHPDIPQPDWWQQSVSAHHSVADVDADSVTDADVDTNALTDIDAVMDTGTDVDTNEVTDTGTAYAHTDTDTDTDTDVNTNTDADADTDTDAFQIWPAMSERPKKQVEYLLGFQHHWTHSSLHISGSSVLNTLKILKWFSWRLTHIDTLVIDLCWRAMEEAKADDWHIPALGDGSPNLRTICVPFDFLLMPHNLFGNVVNLTVDFSMALGGIKRVYDAFIGLPALQNLVVRSTDSISAEHQFPAADRAAVPRPNGFLPRLKSITFPTYLICPDQLTPRPTLDVKMICEIFSVPTVSSLCIHVYSHIFSVSNNLRNEMEIVDQYFPGLQELSITDNRTEIQHKPAHLFSDLIRSLSDPVWHFRFQNVSCLQLSPVSESVLSPLLDYARQRARKDDNRSGALHRIQLGSSHPHFYYNELRARTWNMAQTEMLIRALNFYVQEVVICAPSSIQCIQ
ncbi:hypothetical protein BD410DRAFT_828105 [Rickenella mellea]|uniref:Uncharacterized protein n=1 Tax=Rickenella mellea TaxID=50990 RepID=A0A4Y7Q5Z2_9AGAM|nr:hypothetical protein BD410DRAFT_828105 [Rickenella mellea]